MQRAKRQMEVRRCGIGYEINFISATEESSLDYKNLSYNAEPPELREGEGEGLLNWQVLA